MAIIKEDVHRLDRLISDISDASRLDAEMSRAEEAPVNIEAMLATLVNMRQATADSDAPRLRLEAGGKKKLLVNGVEGRLAQVFNNLIANAISFSPPESEITLKASAAGGWIIVNVDDQGTGIPEGKEEDIFNRFYTERPGSEKFGAHSGLGLSISKQIVESHGGAITAETLIDGQENITGARFTVRLPMG